MAVFFPCNSVPFRASEWALLWTSEYPWNEQFLLRNNGIHSESIPRNFLERNSVANPSLGQMVGQGMGQMDGQGLRRMVGQGLGQMVGQGLGQMVGQGLGQTVGQG